MKSTSHHWNNIFSGSVDSKLGWYEKDAAETLKLLYLIPNWQGSSVFISGAGTSVLIYQLLEKNNSLVLNDISAEALNEVKRQLKNTQHEITWLCQDISLPIQNPIPKVDIWIDRAVLHFLTDENDIKGYFENVNSTLDIGSHAIFAEFSKSGEDKCAGLNLHRYSVDELSESLTPSFKLITSFDHIYINPKGEERPYIYTLYKRIK